MLPSPSYFNFVLSEIKYFTLYVYSVSPFLEVSFTELQSLRWAMNAYGVNQWKLMKVKGRFNCRDFALATLLS